MAHTLDLTEHLARAGNLNGITIELEPANNGATMDVYTYLSRRSVIRDAKQKVG
jgi:hypothetical protein